MSGSKQKWIALLLALGLNMLGLTKLKVANFLPALLLAPLFSKLFAAL